MKLSVSGMPLATKIIGLVLLPLLFELTLLFAIGSMLSAAEKDAAHESQLQNTSLLLKNLFTDYTRLGFMFYAYKEVSTDEMKQSCRHVLRQIPEEIRSLKSLTLKGDNAKEGLEQLEEIEERTLILLNVMESRLDDPRANRSGISHSAQIRTSLSELLSLLRSFGAGQGIPEFGAERKDKEIPSDFAGDFRARSKVVFLISAGAFLNVLIALFLAWFSSKDIIKRLNVINSNTIRASNKEALLPRVGGKDEIAALDLFFHKMVEALEEASRQKDEMVALVSHDLRSPLASIRLSMEAVATGLYGELRKEAVRALSGSIKSLDRLANLINDILDISKLDAGEMKFNQQVFPLRQALEASAEAVFALAKEREVKIELNCDSTLSAYADADRVTQITVNFLSNAIKFSPKNSTVRVEAELAEGNRQAKISVIDRGPGVPEKFKKKIFERYSQVKTSDGQRGKGTGLGLAICVKLVEAQNGQIGLESKEGEGSSFWFTLPLKGDSASDAGGSAASA